jgi:hypothetical protein
MQTVIPEGPAWILALAVVPPALVGAFKLGLGVVRPKTANGQDRDMVAFQTATRMMLDRLTTVAEKQTEMMALMVQRLDEHDTRTAGAIDLVAQTHQMVQVLQGRYPK